MVPHSLRRNKLLRFVQNRNVMAVLISLVFVLTFFTHHISSSTTYAQNLARLRGVQQAIVQTDNVDGQVVDSELLLQDSVSTEVEPITSEPVVVELDIHKIATNFFDHIFHLLEKHLPESTKLERNYNSNCTVRDEGVNTDTFYTKEDLLDCLQIPDEIFSDLKAKHLAYVDAMPTQFPSELYSGRGIVMVGGGKFSMMSYLSLKMLRERGNDLPVEVFIPPLDDKDFEFCNLLLPELNAKCIYLNSIISEDVVKTFAFKGYQYKSLLLLASSFAQVLLIDADNFIMQPVNHIFDHLPFNTTGLVTWPDYWKRLINPKYYDIVDIPIGDKRVRYYLDDITDSKYYNKGPEDARIPFHDRAGTIPEGSTESGQLLFDKYKHAPTLLLSLYYNVYGPSHYYPIFSQGKAGEGDKDTFLLLLHFFGLKYYQVKKAPVTSGYFKKNKSFKGVAMMHSDPVKDFEIYNSIKPDFYLEKSENEKEPYKYSYFSDHFKYNNLLFVHSHLPKFDPLFLFKTKEIIDGGDHVRMYTDTSFCDKCDFELMNFALMRKVMCDKNHIKFLYTAGLTIKELNEVCEFLGEHEKFLLETTKKE